MTGTDILLDSNIIIYYFDINQRDTSIDHIIENNFLHTSVINEIEVMGFQLSQEKTLLLNEFFDEITIYSITNMIKKRAVYLKRVYHLKTADSIVAATARTYELPLISADKIFSRVDEISFFQYVP